MADAASHLWGLAAGVGNCCRRNLDLRRAQWLGAGRRTVARWPRLCDGLFPRVFASTDDNGTPRTGLLIVGRYPRCW